MDIKTDDRGVEYVENATVDTLPDGWALCGHCLRAWNDEKPTAWTPAPSGRCPFEYDHVPDPDPVVPLAISWSGEASENFAEIIGNMHDWYVQITPQNGKPFDAVIRGAGGTVEIDGGTWYDAVTFVRANPNTGEPLPDATDETLRVSRVHVY